jgi:hypothetical protein
MTANHNRFQGAAADLFASAVILFSMLTGSLPFGQAIDQEGSGYRPFIHY